MKITFNSYNLYRTHDVTIGAAGTIRLRSHLDDRKVSAHMDHTKKGFLDWIRKVFTKGWAEWK